MWWRLAAVIGCSLLLVLVQSIVHDDQKGSSIQESNKSSQETLSIRQYHRRRLSEERELRKWKLPAWGAKEWCGPPQMPPINFQKCDHSAPVNIIPLGGGLTNALKIILLGAMMSMEQGNRCFTIDETYAHLRRRKNKQDEFPSFMRHFFEPIGLPYDHPTVQDALKQGRVYHVDVVPDLFESVHNRRIDSMNYSIPLLMTGSYRGHFLKKIALRRLWRPLREWREATCSSLEEYGLEEDFIAFSVRRGDKKDVEHFEYQDLNDYLIQAEIDIEEQFNGKAPKIFVATDDCSVMTDFRFHRPDWTFVSECDRVQQQEATTSEEGGEGNKNGFALKDVGSWTMEQTDDHFRKFFKELYAMALSKVFIGVGYTNVAWWAYFMRPDRHSFRLVDQKNRNNIDYW